MRVLKAEEIFQIVCRTQDAWGIMAHFAFITPTDPISWRDEIFSATKGLVDISGNDFEVTQQIITNGSAATVYMMFKTEAEMEDAFYNRIYGDDNSDTHGYAGALHTIRCLTCSPTGELMNENS